jgi:hypothetical protein
MPIGNHQRRASAGTEMSGRPVSLVTAGIAEAAEPGIAFSGKVRRPYPKTFDL